MKRIVALALVCCLCFSLSACGKSKEAKKADELILAIGEVSLSSAQIISDAQSYYEALTDKQKREVENYDVLQEAQYLYARQLLGYDIPGLMFRIIEGGVQTNDKEAIDEAVSILENLGDYKESKELLVKCEVSLKVLDKESNYQKAITLFSEGDFEEARTVFDTLGNDYEDTQKYLAAMTWLDKYIGEWVLKEGYLSATDFDKTVANDLVLTIAPPYAIRKPHNLVIVIGVSPQMLPLM